MTPPSFPPIFVINLERSRERRDAMQRSMSELGLDCTFIQATDGNQLTAADLTQVDVERRLRIANTPLTNAEIGCYLSHMRLWQRVLEGDQPWALILEDDLLIDPDLPQVLGHIVGLGQAWDLIRLAGLFPAPALRLADLDGKHGLDLLLNTACGLQAYCLSRHGARKLLRHALPIVRQVDNFADRYWENDLAILAVSPYPIQQNEATPSEIGNQRRQQAIADKLREGYAHRWARRLDKWRDSLAKRRRNLKLLKLAKDYRK